MKGKRLFGIVLVSCMATASILATGSCHRSRGSHADGGSGAFSNEGDASGPVISEIDLSHGAPEVKTPSIFHEEKGSFYELIETLHKVTMSTKTKGVLVRFGSVRLGWGRAMEIGRALHALRSAKKTIFCQADELTNGAYWTAAQGCDRLWLSPAGSADTVGLAAELLFAHELLQKAGVDIDVMQIGKFKGTGEIVTRDSASDEVKESLGGLLRDLRAVWLEGIEQARAPANLQVTALEKGPYSANEAKANGLVDETGYGEEARDALRHQLGAAHVQVDFGASSSQHHAPGSDWIEAVRVLTGTKRPGSAGAPSVAVLRASGAIGMAKSGRGLLGDGGISYPALSKAIRGVREDASVKAVVLRIDSPGGSALASDLLWHDLMQLRHSKPLVVSIGDMAASGGYYLACAATKIVADPTSIIGSIGVVGGKLAFGSALRPLGVHVESIAAADESAAKARASYESMFTPWDGATRERVFASMTSVYDLFLRRVAEGRNLPLDQVQGFAEGRIFSGREARSRGMVDEWGGLERAIELARAEAHLADTSPLRLIEDTPTFWDLIGLGDEDDTDDEAAARSVLQKGVGPGLQSMLPVAVVQGASHAQSLVGPFVRGEHTLVALPFVILLH